MILEFWLLHIRSLWFQNAACKCIQFIKGYKYKSPTTGFPFAWVVLEALGFMGDQKKYLQEKVRNSYIRNDFLNIWSHVQGFDNPELFLVLNLNDFKVMKADSLEKYI